MFNQFQLTIMNISIFPRDKQILSNKYIGITPPTHVFLNRTHQQTDVMSFNSEIDKVLYILNAFEPKDGEELRRAYKEVFGMEFQGCLDLLTDHGDLEGHEDGCDCELLVDCTSPKEHDMEEAEDADDEFEEEAEEPNDDGDSDSGYNSSPTPTSEDVSVELAQDKDVFFINVEAINAYHSVDVVSC